MSVFVEYMITYTKLSTLSYNIWNNPKDRQKRLDQLCLNITVSQPDVILLQEVTNATVLDVIKTLKLCDYNYQISNNNNRTIFEIVASKRPIEQFKFSRYSNSITNRGVLWADIKVGPKTVTIVSTQLEQLDQRKAMAQIKCLLKFASTKDNVVLACDIGSLEKLPLPEGWKDSWVVGGQNKFAQYTIDPERNKYIDGNEHYRSDRILLLGGLTNVDFSLVDTGPDDPLVSAHFGIKVIVQISLGIV